MSERNRELIEGFEKQIFSDDLSTIRVEKYVETLRRIGEMLGKDFDRATKDDIEELVYGIERSDYSP